MPSTLGTPDTHVHFAVTRTQDWAEPLPTLLDPDTELPRNITGLELRIYIRPTYAYSEPIAIYSTIYGDIIFDTPASGETSILVSRANVIATLPAGEWRWFAMLIDGADSEEVWRGRFVVYPGEVTGSPLPSLDYSRIRGGVHWLFLGGI